MLTVGFLLASQANAEQTHTFTNLSTMENASSHSFGINNVGQMAGTAYAVGNTASRAIRWDGATATDLGTLEVITAKPLASTMPARWWGMP